MKFGGLVVDVVIVVNVVLGLMEFMGNGIGGDLFVIVWDLKMQKLYGYNGLGWLLKLLILVEFQCWGLKEILVIGLLLVLVLGVVDGWFVLYVCFGCKLMVENLVLVICYVCEGYLVVEVIVYYWDCLVFCLFRYFGFSEQFIIDGYVLCKGQMWWNLNLVNMLEKIVQGGCDVFYKGEIVWIVGDYFKVNGGYFSYDDLVSYYGEWVELVSSNYWGYDVWELLFNSQGIVVLQIFNVLEGYDFLKIVFGLFEYVYLFVEVKKLVFVDCVCFYIDLVFYFVLVDWLIFKGYVVGWCMFILMDKVLCEV